MFKMVNSNFIPKTFVFRKIFFPKIFEFRKNFLAISFGTKKLAEGWKFEPPTHCMGREIDKIFSK